jgi:hypothetical protein
MWEGDAEGLSCTTSGCHDLVELPKKADPDEAILYYKNAYHELCITCHKKIKVKNQQLVRSGSILKDKLPPTGPTGCTECHPQ